MVSADARYIADATAKAAKHTSRTLWDIFVVLPAIICLLFALGYLVSLYH